MILKTDVHTHSLDFSGDAVSYMEEMWLGSRKYGHSYFWKKIVVVQMKQLLKKLTGNIDDSINFSTIFSYLSKPIGAAFFSIAYILYTSVL